MPRPASLGVGVPEAAGGSGGDLADVGALRVAGRHAGPVPLAETGMLGGWLLAGTGLEIPDGAVTVVPEHGHRDDLELRGGALHGTAHRVPWARAVDEIVALLDAGDGPMVVQVDPLDVRIEPR